MDKNGVAVTIGGVPVQIQPFFLLVIGFLAFSAGRTGVLIPVFMGLAFASVLIHELGHAAAFRRFGRRPHVVLHGFGGYTAAPGPALEPAKNLVVSLAGSVTQICLLGIPAVIALRAGVGDGTDVRTILFDLAWVSIGWGILNLIPLLPLDGGQVMVSLIDLVAPGRGTRIGHMVSVAVAVVAVFFAAKFGLLFGAIFAAMFAGQNIQALQATKDQVDGHKLTKAFADLRAGDASSAIGQAEAVLAKKSTARPKALAVELLAWEKLFAHDPGASTETLRRLPQGATPSGFYRGCLELAVGREPEGIGILAEAFATNSGGSIANLAARYVSETGEVETLLTHLLIHDAQNGGDRGLQGIASLQSALHLAARFADAATAGSRVYSALDTSSRPTEGTDRAAVAYNIACSLSRAAEFETAAAWLLRSIEDGLPDPAAIEFDTDLAALRSSPAFADVQHLLGAPR